MTEQIDNIALREALKKMFSVGTHSLQFTKKDGTVREMIATRDDRYARSGTDAV